MNIYSYAGQAFTEEQINKRATSKGLSLEEYLNQNPEITAKSGKAQDSTVDPTMSQDGMGSGLDDGSSESVSWFDQTWFGRGVAAASTTGEATDLMAQDFSNIDMESIQEFMKAKESEAKTHVPSERMEKFQKKYKEEGSTWSAFFRGVKDQPGLLPELFVQSLGTQVGTLIDSPGASLAAAGTGAAGGAMVGAVPGAVAGFMGGLATSMEAALTFGELLETELKEEGKEFTDENIKALLEGPKGNSIRNRAIGRGLTIGAVEGLSGGIAGKAAVATKGAVAAVRGAKTTAVAAGAAGVAVEGVGGGVGEVLGRVAADQEMDAAEIGFEAITGTTTAPINILTALKSAKQPTYSLNGVDVTYKEMKDFVETADDIDVAKAKIKIEDDFTGVGTLAAKKQNKAIVDSQIDDKITDKKDRDTLIELNDKRIEAEANVKKKGIDKVPNAPEELATIQAEIDAIIGKYEGAMGIGETQKAQDVAKVVRENRISDTIAFAETQGQRIGKQTIVVDNNEQAQAAHDKIAKEMGLKAQDVTDADGFIVGDSIIINKDVAGRNGAINVGAHEVLHGVLAKHMQSLDNTGKKKLISSFKKVLSKNQLAAVTKRLEDNYSDVKGFDIETTEEWFTAFSDAIEQNEIAFDEGVFSKLKNTIQEILRKFGIKKDFADGRQAYNFLKDYSKSIENNKLSSRAMALAGEGAAVTESKFSKTASDKVQSIYEEQGEAGAFEIIEQFKPIVSKIAEKRREAPNFDKELLMSEIEIGKRGILDLVKEYKSESGVPLAAYINKYLPSRAIEASRRVLGEEFTDDISERVDIAAEEVAEVDIKAKPKKKKIILSDRLGVKGKIDKAIKAKLPELDIENLNFKTLKDQAPEITGEMFGISPKKLISGANITKKELQSAQMFINKNADVLISMLPEGATASGTATGVPQTLLKAFYTKTDRAKMAKTGTKAGLAIQVKNDINKTDFLETFGIIDGKPDRTDRNTSARVLALANQTGKMMTNQAVREQLFENITEENAKSMLKLSDGKSAVMFSKSKAKENNMPNIAKYFGEKTEAEVASILDQHASLTEEQFKEAFPNEHGNVKNYIEDMAQFVADGGKEAMQFTKEMKGTNFGNSELTNYLKTGYWTLSDAKFKQDKKAMKWFVSNAHNLANQILLPKNATNGNMRMIMGFFAGHYNIVGSDMAKVGSVLKQGIVDRLNEKGKSVLSKETLSRWKNFDFENLKSSYASTFYTGLKKIYAANTLKEQKAIAKEYFTGKEGATQKDFYDLWNTTLEEWLHSSEVGSKEFNSKADYILKLKKANAAIGTTGERVMAPGGYVYLPGSIMDGKIKFEHLKSSSQQSKESALLVINNKFKEFGDLATEDYTGIYGPLELFNAVDDATGKVNSSNIFRLAGNLEAAKSIYSIDNLNQSLYDDIVSTIGKDKIKFLEQAGDKSQVKKLDKAIAFSRSANNETKGITVLDFDDTLATTKSGVRAKIPNMDGLPKPQRKVIFLAGGAGSGKGNVISKLGLKDQGFKIVNSDISLEWLKKNSGLPASMNDFTKEQRSKLGSLQHQARGIAKRKMTKYQGNADGVVVDGTGGSIKSMEKLVNEFKDKGYDVSMMFVETSLPVALERNAARKERSLLDKIVEKNHAAVQDNKDGFKTMFGDRFMEVNTDNLSQQDAMPSKLTNKMNDFVSGYENRRLDAEEFASEGADILEQGGTFDFSEFNKVVEGQTAPLFEKAMKLQGKFGNKDMFVLTARPAESAQAIFEFLKANGLNIPLKNITGLANSTSEAKALWIADKVGEGFNDFYFADDALQNVQAVKNMLDQFDVKSKVQQAKVNFSKSMNDQFNDILENVTGIESDKRFSAIKGRKRGESKGKFRVFIPPSHEDFVGLLYNFLGKGKEGNKHRDFFEQALVRPLNRANREFDTARQSVANDYKELNKQFEDVKEKLTKKTPDGDFTFQDAIRVYLWDKHCHKIPGLSETDQAKLAELVMSDPQLQAYAETLNVISKQETYVNPTDGWNGGDIRMDLDDATGRIGRKQFFAEFIENADVIFSEQNLNKIEAGYGNDVRESLEDILYRIQTGRNRPSGQNKQVNKLMNYLNGSVGTVMFFNMRSALLQQMSIVNYINFADNNIFAAAKAFANQKQYWADFAFIFNSDMLKQRRGGIQTDVNGAELAASLRNSKDITRKLISKLLEIGFLPTQIGDNIAIATGGAAYYRNRINKYVKQGMSQKEAEAAAFTDFQDITQSTQQSARPDMVSKQQASVIGKVILNFQNVTSQFNRLGKKAFQDIYNRRITKPNTTQIQSDISNASRITYYFAIQNAIFYTLQTALFAMMFDDDEEDVNNLFIKKQERLINGSIDSVLRGTGLIGGVVATLKNVAIAWARQRDVKYNPDESAVALEALNLSPVLGIKMRKIVNAEKTLNYNKKVIDGIETFDIDNPQWSAVTNYTEAFTNIPLNRLYNKTQNVRQSLNNDHAAWERTLMFLGWSQYNLDLENKKMEDIKSDIKEKKKKTKKKKKRADIKIRKLR